MKFKSNDVDLKHEDVGKLLLKLALPAIMSQIVNALYNVVDRMYIGHIETIGSVALTGVGVCFPLIMIISAFASLFGMGGAPLASISMGKGDNEHAEKIMGNCFMALIIIALILTFGILGFQKPLLYLFGASDATIGYALEYMSIYAIGTIFVELTLGMNSFISAQGYSKVAMMTVCIGAITNIVLDPIFIYVFDMGVKGAAIATIFSQMLSAVFAISFLSSANSSLRLKKHNFKIMASIIMPCIALGVAPFVMQATESVLTLCFNSSLQKYGGDLAVGAMTILSSIMQFATLPLQGLTQGGQPIISYNYGALNKERVRKAFKYQTIACFSYAFIVWLLVMFIPDLLVGVFSDSIELAALTIWALRIYMFAIALMGLQISCQQAFIAFGYSKVSAFLAIFRKIIVLIPLIYILPHFMEDKVFAVFLAEPIADTIAVLTTCLAFAFEFKHIMAKMDENDTRIVSKHHIINN